MPSSKKSSKKEIEKKIIKGKDTSTAAAKSADDNVPPAKKIEELYTLIEGIDIAMMTSRNFDGTLIRDQWRRRRSVLASISGS